MAKHFFVGTFYVGHISDRRSAFDLKFYLTDICLICLIWPSCWSLMAKVNLLVKRGSKTLSQKKGSTAIINLTNWSESDEWYQWWAIMMKMMKIVMMRCITVWASAIITDIFRFSCRNAVSSLITSANCKNLSQSASWKCFILDANYWTYKI